MVVSSEWPAEGHAWTATTCRCIALAKYAQTNSWRQGMCKGNYKPSRHVSTVADSNMFACSISIAELQLTAISA